MQRSDVQELILASGSRTRHQMLVAAGVSAVIMPADVDEDAIRQRLRQKQPDITPVAIADALACAKAEAVSRHRPEALVIGSDQVLSLAGETISKPRSTEEARAILMWLSGRTHELNSAAALAEGGKILWHHVATARLTMRAFSYTFLSHYLEQTHQSVVASTGVYQIEGLGAQLFEHIEGDHFTILGMPLLPLLAELRARKVMMT